MKLICLTDVSIFVGVIPEDVDCFVHFTAVQKWKWLFMNGYK